MRYKILILIITVALVVLSLKNYGNFHEDVVHLKNSNGEFKKKPEHSIESTVLHREKEVYDHVFHFGS